MVIRKVLLTTVATVAICGTAFAADLPSRRAPPVYVPPPIPVFSWTGFYIGGQVGYEFGRDRSTLINANGAALSFGIPQHGGAIGGAHVGYNYALNGYGGGLLGGGLVVGIEGDFDGIDNRSAVGFQGPLLGFFETHRSDIEGSIRGRLGVAVDRALFYVTGGAAFTQFHDGYLGTITIPPTTLGFPVSGSSTKVGYTVGGGVEYAVTPNWSLRAEYRYTDFGSSRYDITGAFPVAIAPPITAVNKAIEQRVQVGFSYRFADAIAPVVARY